MNKFLSTIAGAAMALGFVGTANAAVLTINFTGADVTYDGSTICDAGGCAGSNLSFPGSFADADPLASVDFFIDYGAGNVLVGSLSDDLYFDLMIEGVTGLADTGLGSTTTIDSGFGFDLLAGDGGVLVDFDGFSEIDIVFSNNVEILFVGGDAEIFAQLLPFDLMFTDITDVTVSLSAQASSITSSDGFITGFDASGTGEISGPGEQLPEPAALGFLGLGLVGLGFARRRKQRAA